MEWKREREREKDKMSHDIKTMKKRMNNNNIHSFSNCRGLCNKLSVCTKKMVR